jgi:polyisoprenoid-binding protein YceI
MPLSPGTYTLGPADATLTVRTGTAGPMAKAAHNLELWVTSWSAELVVGEELSRTTLSLEADSRSLRVIGGHGGPKPLTDADKPRVEANIDNKVLKGGEISFRSTAVGGDGDRLAVEGELSLLGSTGPASFTLTVGEDGHISASTTVTQTAFGIEPYSAMMGALRVSDEVGIEIDGRLPAA